MKRRALVSAVIVLVATFAFLIGLRELARSPTVQVFGRLVARVDASERVIALTFDDGPAVEVLNEIIEVFWRHAVSRRLSLSLAPNLPQFRARAGSSWRQATNWVITRTLTDGWSLSHLGLFGKRSRTLTLSFEHPVTWAKSTSGRRSVISSCPFPGF